MPPPSERPASVPVLQPGPRSISVGVAFAAWALGWLAGNVLASVVLVVSGQQNVDSARRPVWTVAALALALWLPQIVAVAVAVQRFGQRRAAIDCRLGFASIDLLGLPIGVASQLVLLWAVYWPLKHWWPQTFSEQRLEENARELYERATGGWVVVLVIIVAIGAPLVEELVYRGLIQSALMSRISAGLAVVVAAGFFALIHFRPIEYPGLFAFGLVLGVCLAITKRIGMGIAAHMAFNATALVLVAR